MQLQGWLEAHPKESERLLTSNILEALSFDVLANLTALPKDVFCAHPSFEALAAVRPSLLLCTADLLRRPAPPTCSAFRPRDCAPPCSALAYQDVAAWSPSCNLSGVAKRYSPQEIRCHLSTCCCILLQLPSTQRGGNTERSRRARRGCRSSSVASTATSIYWTSRSCLLSPAPSLPGPRQSRPTCVPTHRLHGSLSSPRRAG